MKWVEYLEKIDQNLLLILNGNHDPFIDQMMWIVSNKLFGVPFYLFFVYLVYKTKGLLPTIFIVIVTGIAVGITDYTAQNLIKENIQRFRPSHHLILKDQLNFVFDYRGGQFGFVSNHAANMASVALLIFLYVRDKYRHLWLLFLVFVLLISYSRIYLGVHYPSDIVGGWIWGSSIAAIFYYLSNKILT